MSARVEKWRTDHRGTLIGAPDLTRERDGRPFLAEGFHVYVRPGRSAGAWVWVEGRAVRVDGSIGTAARGDCFDLPGGGDGRSQSAPEWLVAALKAAGVTW